MTKLYIYLFAFLALSCAILADDKKGTVGIYVSPHGISRETQVHEALVAIADKVKIVETVYQHGSLKYTIKNATVDIVFLDGKQTIDIVDQDRIKVSGGRMEFQYAFNFTREQPGSGIVSGWANGYVVSQSFNYTKELFPLEDGHTKWTLTPGSQGYTNLSIGDRMTIKRMEPYNEADYDNLVSMLDRAFQSITPHTVEYQLLTQFNTNMPSALNTTLHNSVIEPEFEYKFHSPTHGEIGMNITNSLWGFGIQPENGYQIIYLSEIKGEPQPCLNQYVLPDKPLAFSFYGGHQTIYSNCFYDSVLQYLHKKGWLDITLNNDWDCNAFQFYVGDLYDLINNLYKQVNPREPLTGECKPPTQNLSMNHTRDESSNMYKLGITYQCMLRGSNKQGQQIDIMKFNAEAIYDIKTEATKSSILFSIQEAEIMHLQFEPVGNFFVNNPSLALFKANQIMAKLQKTPVFGNGYPLNYKEYPKAEVRESFVVYYDAHSASLEKGELIEEY